MFIVDFLMDVRLGLLILFLRVYLAVVAATVKLLILPSAGQDFIATQIFAD